ncbi:MAG: SRPBCC domain-containing protein [Chloroflexi bacterium]|nr:SRPBCC domain-containing protein [Chloroflexota bacterium]
MDALAIERTIWIHASRERVWLALTHPQQVSAWFAPGTVFKSSGSEVGSRLYVEDQATGAELYTQILEVVDPPSRLELRSQPESPAPSFVTSYRLDEENGGTRLTLVFSGYEGLPEGVRQQVMDENSTGFELMLGNIKAYIEGLPLPNPQGF